MAIGGIIALMILVIFIGLDYLFFLIRQSNLGKEGVGYFPDKRIWGLGAILGISIFLFYFFKKDILVLETGEKSNDIFLQFGKLLVFLAMVAIIFAAIVKVVKED